MSSHLDPDSFHFRFIFVSVKSSTDGNTLHSFAIHSNWDFFWTHSFAIQLICNSSEKLEISDRENFWKFFEFFSKFSQKFVEKIRFWSSFERPGTSGKSRATRCQNSSLLRRLATTKTSKKRFGKKLNFWGVANELFVIFLDFSRS